MKVVHIESGLGNQMLSFCEYIAIKKMNPEEMCYIETLVYDIPEANEYICQWNGYELKKVFGINSPNIIDTLSKEEQTIVINAIKQSKFWLHEWNWPVYFTKAFHEAGLDLENTRGDFEAQKKEFSISRKTTPPLSYRIKQTGLYSNFRRIALSILNRTIPSDAQNLFYTSSKNQLLGQRLSFMKRNNKIELIDKEIREVFRFPAFSDCDNIQLSKEISECQSVAIHARRGDMLTSNGQYYKNGYFRRATKFIKKKVSEPVFFFFCDKGSIDWCKYHARTFGLNFKHDKVRFVDINHGDNSFRDMQLMSMCKHNIITYSSFGWWGAYFNQNPNKITISPDLMLNTLYHM